MTSSVTSTDNDVLLEVNNLKTHFPIKGGLLRRTVATVKAVDGVSFAVKRGETLGLVGESGCGKTTTGRTVLRLERATEGEVLFEGHDVLRASRWQMKRLRRDMQIVFQDPYASLDPRITIGESVEEGLIIHGIGNAHERRERVRAVLDKVGLHANQMNRFPHEFSGGQRQRIGIARALIMEPKLIVCDEPVSALDVSIQSQVLNLLKNLQREFGLTYLFIAHNLAVVEHISDRVGVMYLGKVVELSGRDDLFRNPLHPYTKALISAIPQPDPTVRRARIMLQGDVPSPINPPTGCRFHPRCWIAQEICKTDDPAFEEKRKGHWAACHFAGEA
ncbi:ABC transporter ATP-binding protein [Candidatus Viridilinea mediisalina]|uniref:Peptide ABC transporter substrate-binding protein n=1 Tax=Candidatus Viridilinea mediisalina TaxID=2024553 RepID=A0A2A6RFG9_9CHLR|nr:dipeptide ABC transporter ATP-binding protein [Candidatus Viridilinea mediisalina]PDW01681.1 peptide ABC transporter substrate-binding protein [Candidatus Viridilinea mediisalina]